MLKLDYPNHSNDFYSQHITLLVNSYQRLLNKPLATDLSAEQLFNANFALLSHNTDAEPVFNYANQKALDLFEFSWDELIGMPSRLSAESINQQDRERLLAEVTRKGFIDHYSGVRISKTGKRFLIENAVVWNIYDQNQQFYGQAACFDDWTWL